ncbi:MAG TPA: hypothetical protein VML55_14070 [Planctomycetaceae bacterium]|nr:hypothetical protein [Planctomycetaceae bacterium]
MLVTVKSREVQRGLLAEMRGDRQAASRHLMAAGHLELVLAEDYESQGEAAAAFRSRLSAASCFWRAGEPETAKRLCDDLKSRHPERISAVDEVAAELQRDYPTR